MSVNSSEDSIDIGRTYMGRFYSSVYESKFCVDGRFAFTYSDCDFPEIYMIDLFHGRKSGVLRSDFSSATINNISLIPQGRFCVKQVLPVSLDTLIIISEDYGGVGNRYLAIGKLDFNQSRVSILNTISVPLEQGCWKLIGQTERSNLTDGILSTSMNINNGNSRYQTIKFEYDGQLRITQSVELPNRMQVIGFFDEFICGFIYKRNGVRFDLKRLVKVSISTSEVIEQTTKNTEILFKDNCTLFDYNMVCLGPSLFLYAYYASTCRSRIFSLDLKTLEWTNSRLDFNGRIHVLRTDGEKTLIVSTYTDVDGLNSFYRFAIRQPDSLADLTCIAIKRRTDQDASFYSYILSKLPKNSRFRCPNISKQTESDVLKNMKMRVALSTPRSKLKHTAYIRVQSLSTDGGSKVVKFEMEDDKYQYNHDIELGRHHYVDVDEN
ncbi:hypothetical protein M3Y98_01190200 [Aphelenchoides besseyi]|nr:hypothetical protein M3Y98_01190200 [Aphelenchoides besseyi]KAI6195041.1 hypothetical protein M3Y96_01189000 [Aphelenchoides besseyi]